MSKVLVTGMTSRTANPEASVKDVTFARLLADALREGGHEVSHRDPHVEEDLSDFDHVFVGLAPLHGLGANRMYGGISAIMRTISDGRLTIYSDDPVLDKMVGGIRTMANSQARFTKPFFAYRKEYEIANSDTYRDWLHSGVNMLADYQWPRLLVPMFPWADAEAYYGRRVPQAAGRITGVDLTKFMPQFDIEPQEREQRWILEDGPDGKWMRQVQNNFPVTRWGKHSLAGKRPWDSKMVEEYARVWGVMAPPVDPVGWWTSRMGFAAQAGAVYVSRWQDLAPLGEPYALLPYQVEALSLEERDDLAVRQRDVFDKMTSSKDEAVTQLDRIVEKVNA